MVSPTLRLPRHAYHIVDLANWEAVQRDGLLPASDLIGRDPGAVAAELNRAHRPKAVTLADDACLRDQAPMPPSALAKCLLPPLTPADWYELVNQGVYFWLDEERLTRHLHALRGAPTVLLTFDAAALASAFADAAYVTPFNVGSARRKPARRGVETFVPYLRWRRDGWRSEADARGARRQPYHPPAELVIRAPIRPVLDLTLSVTTQT